MSQSASRVGACAAPLVLACVVAMAQESLRNTKSRDSVVKSNAPPKTAMTVAKRIDHYCDLFGEFYDALGLQKKNDNHIVMRLFGTHDEYEQYVERTTKIPFIPAAYFSPSLNAIVAYHDESDIYLRQTVFHECSHQFLNRYTYDAPKWLNEGLAEFFEGWRVPDGGQAERRENLFDVVLLHGAFDSGKVLRPRDLVALSPEAFTDFAKGHADLHPYLHYATSWGLVYHALMGHDDADHDRLVNYLRDLNKIGTRAEFRVDDWDAYERRWRAFLGGIEPKRRDLDDHLLVASGYREGRDWKAAANEYLAAIDSDPESADVNYWLGWCLKRAGDYQRATKYLEKARTLEPTQPRAPYQLSHIALGREQKGAASDAQRATQLAEEAVKLGGNSAVYLVWLAVCQEAKGDADTAIKTLNRAYKIADEDDREFIKQRINEVAKKKR